MIKILEAGQAAETLLSPYRFAESSDSPALRGDLERLFGEPLSPEEAVARIIADVRSNGDKALVRWSKRLDNVSLESIRVDPALIESAPGRLDGALLSALKIASQRIRAFHQQQPLPDWQTGSLGGTLGQRTTPIQRAGIYVPGGSAPLPSSLLMAAIPAQVAGVPEIVAATPPGRPEGHVSDVILATAHLLGIETVYSIGGAQAIAALAYGSRSVERVDKIVGAGNLFTTLAKRQVYGRVGIDGLFGPTETLIIADDSANPTWVAADMLAQAEHDPLATALLLTPSRDLAERVRGEIGRQVEHLSRAEIILASLARGGIVITPDLDEACRLASVYAAEHTCLSVQDPHRYIEKIENAGGLFVGEHSFEVLGDYVAGPSHIMPTGGSARFASPLSVLDFVKITSVIALDSATSQQLSPIAAQIASAERLTAHAEAAAARRGNDVAPPAFDPANLLRPHVTGMAPYAPVLPFEELSRSLGRNPASMAKLDANENPYGMPPRVREALASGRWFHIYPDPESRLLRQALCDVTGLPVENLLAGAGADELIDLVLRAVLDPGDEVINCPPSFGMYPFSTAVNAGQIISIPRRADYSIDVDAIEQQAGRLSRPKVLFLCSPNNPDGSLITGPDLERLLRLPLLVILDEAYIDFAAVEGHHSKMSWVPDHPNLVVLRTFSKVAGLAGLRVGYGAFPLWLTPHLLKIKQPYNVNVAATYGALAALEDRPWLEEHAALIVSERRRMVRALAEFEFLRPMPSQANFVLFEVCGRSAAALKQHLATEGVLVRHFDAAGVRDCIRISAGRPQDTDRLVQALRKLEEESE